MTPLLEIFLILQADKFGFPFHVPCHWSPAYRIHRSKLGFFGAKVLNTLLTLPLHQAELLLNGTPLDLGTSTVPRIDIDLQSQRATVSLGSYVLHPGPLQMELTFKGILNDDMMGFYRKLALPHPAVIHWFTDTIGCASPVH